MSVDGTDLTKITGDGMKVIAEAAVAAGSPRAGWFLSRVAAAVLAVVLPLLGGVVGFVTGRTTGSYEIPGEVVSAGSGSGSAAVSPGSGSASLVEVTRIPYDAKTVAADAILGTPDGTGDATHPAHPADAAAAAEADAK